MAREDMRPPDRNEFRSPAEESKDAAEMFSAASSCLLSTPGGEGASMTFDAEGVSPLCPVCSRAGTLMAIGEAWMCAACGYSSDSAAGCT